MAAQDRGRGRIGVEAPRGKQAHMTPCAYAGGDAVSGFVKVHRHAARDEVSCSGEPDRAGADDGDGKLRLLAHASYSVTSIVRQVLRRRGRNPQRHLRNSSR